MIFATLRSRKSRLVLVTACLSSLMAAVSIFAVPSVTRATKGKPSVIIVGAGEISDSSAAPIVAKFSVFVFFEFPEVTCLPDNPNCNDKTVSVCVDYHTVAETATENDDFVPVQGRLNQTLVFHGSGDDQPLGIIEVSIVSDTAAEGAETFKVVLTEPGGSGCVNKADIDVREARATIVDGDAKKPDLVVTDLRLVKGCQIAFTIKNAGNAPLPEVAYDTTHGAAIQLRRNGQPWGGTRLFAVDPLKKLNTPGTSITHLWFPHAANLKVGPGVHLLNVVVDKNNVVAESNETNNSREKRLTCPAL